MVLGLLAKSILEGKKGYLGGGARWLCERSEDKNLTV